MKDISGTTVSWHSVVLWFLGAVALIALAAPAPTIATWTVIILIALVILTNWNTYSNNLGINK